MPRPLHDHDDDVVLEAERDIRSRLGDRALDFEAMLAVSNIYRAATRFATGWSECWLLPASLGGFTILFVLWVWGDGRRASSPKIAGWPRGL